MYYTVEELIRELNKFPKDLKIATDLSFMFNYPDSLYDAKKVNNIKYINTLKKNATNLCIFEGSWDKDNIADVDNLIPKLLKIREKE